MLVVGYVENDPMTEQPSFDAPRSHCHQCAASTPHTFKMNREGSAVDGWVCKRCGAANHRRAGGALYVAGSPSGGAAASNGRAHIDFVRPH